jgi:type IV pilus assembly protein PilB
MMKDNILLQQKMMNPRICSVMKVQRFFRVLMVLALVLGGFLTNQSFAQTNPGDAHQQAVSLANDGHSVEAWAILVGLYTNSPEAIAANKDLVRQVVRDLNAQLKKYDQMSNPKQVLRICDVLERPGSSSLVNDIWPGFFDQYEDTIRLYKGKAHWQQGQIYINQGQREQAEAEYRKALTLMRDGDPYFPRANLNLAQLIWERGILFWDNGDSATGTKVWSEAVPLYINAFDFGDKDPDVKASAEYRLEQIAAIEDFKDFPGLPKPPPTPEVTRTPEPTPESTIASISNSIKIFFGDLTSGSSDLMGTLLVGGGILVVVILVYWVIPTWILKRFEGKGDIRAAEWRQKVKLMGIFALVSFLVGLVNIPGPFKSKKVAKVSQHGCPHCNKPLDNMFAYEDLVFSRCPHCHNKITPMYSLETYVNTIVEGTSTDAEKIDMGLVNLDEFVKRDVVQRLVQAVVTLGVRRRASDVHVEPDEHGLVIRQRVDGIMTEMFTFPRSMSLGFVSSIKVNANMNIAEKRIPQDGKFQMNIDKTQIDIRVASSPTSAGEKVSMRILDYRSIQLGTNHLGMAPAAQDLFDKTIHQPHGMLLVTGPTGSGKSTTIYVALQQLTKGDKNIISIEDPIEFSLPGVNQTQVNPVAGLTFASALRSILRQDPDIIVVGEIRDNETAEISVNSVQTGHLVFSTLHTVDAASSVARLLDFGVSPRQFADALSLIIAQRLLRLVCQYCKQPFHPDEKTIQDLGIASSLDEYDLQIGQGCKTCNNTGYYRRVGVFELLEPTERMRIEMEKASLTTGQIREFAIQSGMRTLRQEALVMLRQGLTACDEVTRLTIK